MEQISLQDFKNDVMTMLKQNYCEDSTQSIWLKIKDKMNDSNSVFWTDVETYYKEISTRFEAIVLLETCNLALRSNRIIQMTKTQENMTALQYSIFAKFFTKTDCKYTCLFAGRLYNQHKNNTRIARELWAEKNDIIIMMLKAGMTDVN